MQKAAFRGKLERVCCRSHGLVWLLVPPMVAVVDVTVDVATNVAVDVDLCGHGCGRGSI